MNEISIPVSPGELIDKMTILTIKTERILNREKLQNIHYELAILANILDDAVGTNAILETHTAQLKKINEKLWDIEDKIRDCERQGKFDEQFIKLARAVYITNDERSEIKRKINERLGSQIIEEKSYAEYRRSA